MDDLADVFVIDSAGDFKRIGGRELGLQHVFHVSRKIQEALSSKKSATAGMMDLTIKQSDFANILDAGCWVMDGDGGREFDKFSCWPKCGREVNGGPIFGALCKPSKKSEGSLTSS